MNEPCPGTYSGKHYTQSQAGSEWEHCYVCHKESLKSEKNKP